MGSEEYGSEDHPRWIHNIKEASYIPVGLDEFGKCDNLSSFQAVLYHKKKLDFSFLQEQMN